MKKELSIRLSLLGRVKLFVAGWADAYANLFSLYLGEKGRTNTRIAKQWATIAICLGVSIGCVYGAGLFLLQQSFIIYAFSDMVCAYIIGL